MRNMTGSFTVRTVNLKEIDSFGCKTADAVSRLRDVMSHPLETLRATGTDGADSEAQRKAQQTGRGDMRSGGSDCDAELWNGA